MFHIGQKVQCVDAEASGKYLPPGYTARGTNMHGLTLNSVYTIRSVCVMFGISLCRVDELHRPVDPIWDGEGYFACLRFRPITERKTDISVFRALLNPTEQDVRELAE